MARLVQVIMLVFVSLSLTACGGGSGGSESGPTAAVSGGGDSGGSSGDSGGSSGGSGGGGGSTPPSGGTASTTVSWSIPSTRQSGASLAMSEIGGYKVYYGSSSSNLSSTIDVPDAYQTSQLVNNLTSGTTYYFRITAYDSSNAESQQSNLVTKTAS